MPSMTWMPWFKMYAAELLSDERFQGWTLEERGAWITLVCMAWREGSIPVEESALAKLLHIDPMRMRDIWSGIGDRFTSHPKHPGRLTSRRLEHERTQSMTQATKRIAKAKNAAKSRWDKRKRVNAPSNAQAMLNDAIQNRTETEQKQKQRQIQNQPTGTVNAVASDEDIRRIQSDLAGWLGLETLGLGKNPERTVAVFRKHIASQGYECVLSDCKEAAQRSARGKPSSLAFFVGWLENLPVTQ